MVVGFAPGVGNDIVGRLIGQSRSECPGQPVIIENCPGAATNIATESVVRSAPDGYTLLSCGVSSLFESLSYNFIRDIAPALADLLSGQVAVTFASSGSAVGYVQSDKLRAFAVTSATRSEIMPDILAMAEFVPGFEVARRYGIAPPEQRRPQSSTGSTRKSTARSPPPT